MRVEGTLDDYGRPQWLEWRRSGIGASDIAAIMGLSPYSTPYQLWIDKQVGFPEDTDDEAMAWGRRLESLILDTWAAENEYEPTHRGAMIRSGEHGWLIATLDAMESGRVVEVKNSSDWRWDEVPGHYEIQVQHQLLATGAPEGIIVVLHAGRHVETYRVLPDPTLRAAILSEGAAFWESVRTEQPPPVEAEDNAIMATLWPRHVEKVVEVPAESAINLIEARSAYTRAKKRRDWAEAAIKDLMGEADTAVVDQAVVATWRTQTANRIDIKALRRDHPDLLENYTAPSETRVFRAKETT